MGTIIAVCPENCISEVHFMQGICFGVLHLQGEGTCRFGRAEVEERVFRAVIF